MGTDRQTDGRTGMTKLIVAFCNFFYSCAVFVINIVNWFVYRTRIILTIMEILRIFISGKMGDTYSA